MSSPPAAAGAGPATASIRLNNDTPVGRFVELAVAAEESGFDQLWVSHDLFLRSAPVLLAAAAVATRSIRLGTGVLNPYSAHPAELAMHAATLQELSGGRALLGIAAGAAEFLSQAGIEQVAPLARTRRALLACRALLDGEAPAAAAGAGEWSGDARLLFGTRERVPIYLGAMSPRMLALAGEIADGALPLLFPPEHFAVASEQVAAGAEAAGRRREDIDVPACVWVSVAEDPAEARGPLADKLAFYGPAFAPYLLARAGLSPDDFRPAARALAGGDVAGARAGISEEMLRLGIAGTPAEVAARCVGLLAAGATHLSFGPPLGPDPVAAVHLLGEQVLPLVRAAT